MYLPYFKIEILTSRYLTTSLSFEQVGPGCIYKQSDQSFRCPTEEGFETLAAIHIAASKDSDQTARQSDLSLHWATS